MKTTDIIETLSQLYIREIVRLHGVPFSIVIPGLWHGSGKVYNKRWGQSYVLAQLFISKRMANPKGDTGCGRHVTCLRVGLQGKLE